MEKGHVAGERCGCSLADTIPCRAGHPCVSASIPLSGEADTEVPTGTSYVLGDCGMLRPARCIFCISGHVPMTHHMPF